MKRTVEMMGRMQVNHKSPLTENVQAGQVRDTFGRPLRDLRISVTDRCNFRCTYCMPKEIFGADFPFLPHTQMLSFEEIKRLVQLFAQVGVQKIRLTGGEPLLRRDLPTLVEMIASVPGITDIAMTTNGSLLTIDRARQLKEAGLHRVTVSLDALDNDIFVAMNDVSFPVDKVLAGIEAAAEAGLTPVKINMVVKKGENEQCVVSMAEKFRGTGHTVRFIEFMDVGTTNGWRLEDVVPAADIVRMISAKWPLEPVQRGHRSDVASRYRYVDGQGEIGLISSVTQPFCGDCSRARLSSDGQLYTCLFGTEGYDLRKRLRDGDADDDILRVLNTLWGNRNDRYSELRSAQTSSIMSPAERKKIEMSRIGG